MKMRPSAACAAARGWIPRNRFDVPREVGRIPVREIATLVFASPEKSRRVYGSGAFDVET